MLANKLRAATAAGGAPAIEDVFSTYLYTGNGSTQTITNGIDLAGEGGLVWLKSRSESAAANPTGGGGRHVLYHKDGATEEGFFNGGTATMEGATATTVPFNSDGYDVSGSAINKSGETYAGWTFRKAPKFFDVVTYTGDGVAGRTIAHNLGIEPGSLVIKRRDASTDWIWYHRALTSPAEDRYLKLNTTDAESTSGASGFFNSTAPTSSDFTVGNSNFVNQSGNTYVAYLFAHDTAADGVIQCGSYTGNGSTSGPTISLGWEPQWVMIKRSDSSSGADWYIFDNARDTSNPLEAVLRANDSSAESTTAGGDVDFTASGFQLKSTAAGTNASSGTYIYAAIRAEGV